MSKEIYISTTPHETRLAIVEDEQLAEIYFERENEYTLAGSIYNGKVTRVLPGMQSSFVDVGLERDAFLYVTDFMEEQGDAADFESDAGRRAPKEHAQEAAPREGTREAGPREGDRRGRGDRERGRHRDRPLAPEAPKETQSFDEPIAPHPTEPSGTVEQDNLAALEDQGSRRWRGRRGRRRGRTGREGAGNAEAGSATDAGEAEPGILSPADALHATDVLSPATEFETIVLEGSSEDEDGAFTDADAGNIEIDLAALPREPEDPSYGYSRRIRENRREERARERGLTASPERGAVPERRSSEPAELSAHAQEASASVSSAATSVPFVLPGESIRKYRNPAEVSAEEAVRQAAAPPAAEISRPTTTSVEITGWDGGAVLPGESLSRHRRREQGSSAGSRQTAAATNPAPAERTPDAPQVAAEITVDQAPEMSKLGPSDAAEEELSAPTPIPDVAAIAPASAPDETGGLTQHPAHAGERAAVSSVIEAALPEAGQPTSQNAAEYEPLEGERVSLGESSRRDLRRVARRTGEVPAPEATEPVEPSSAAASEAAVSNTAVPEIFASEIAAQADAESAADEMEGRPDATVYDLPPVALDLSVAPSDDQVKGSLGEQTLASQAEQVHGSLEVANETAVHEFTLLERSGDMLSEPPVSSGEDLPQMPLPRDGEHAPAPVGDEGLSLAEEFAEVRSATEIVVQKTAAAPADGQIDGLPHIHAYGDGDLEEEEVDGDEYEYDMALASLEEDEFDDYEEETLEGTADLGEVVQQMSPEQSARLAANDDDDDEDAAETIMETGGFTVDDFGGEPEEELAGETNGAISTDSQDPERRNRRDSRRGGRDRDRRNGGGGGGFRGGAGGDRGRGRGGRPSVQAQDLPAINDLLKPGQEVLVQIAKEPIAKKGARITSHIALPGRFLVFMPTVHHTGVSRKISSDEERRRLKSILLSEKGDAQGGFIVRTAAEGASEEELRNDLRFLIQLWQDIKARSESSKAPALIYHDLSLIERILRDQVTDNFSAIWVDTEGEYERVLRFLQRFQPSLVRRVKLYTKETPIFEHFGVTPEIDRALKSKVWLKSGGSIVIDQTEALVAIDINTGKYVGKTARLEDTILKTNLDAIPEIVRQIRLRDLGGIIVIDFIDMDERKNRAKVMQVLEDELKADRAPSKVLPFNDFGLVIMTRKRVKQSLERTLCMPDPVTEGTGMIKSPITVANEIYVEMRKMHRHLERNDILLRVHPEVVKQLKAAGGKRLQELEEMTHKTILVKSDPALNPEQFDIH